MPGQHLRMDAQHEAATALLDHHAGDLVAAHVRGREGQRHVGELVLRIECTEVRVLIRREVLADAVARAIDVRATHAVEATRTGMGGLGHRRGCQHVVIVEVEHRRAPCAGLDAPDAARLQAEASHRVLDLLTGRFAVLVRAEHAVADVPGARVAVVQRVACLHRGVDLLVASVGGSDERVLVDLIGRREVPRLRAQEVGQAQCRVARVDGLAGARVVHLLATNPRGDLGNATLETIEQQVERDDRIGAAAELVLFRPEIDIGEGLMEAGAKEAVGRVHTARRGVELHVHRRTFRRPSVEQRRHLELGTIGPAGRVGSSHRRTVDEDLVDGLALVRREDDDDVLEMGHRAAVEHSNDGAAHACRCAVDRRPGRFRTDQRGGAVAQVGNVFGELAGRGLARLLLGLR
ncbi:hypothetical protein D3C87_1331210 [compost metagenome]